jgi:pSer/pThr/pTyr-binding forkhead associated (FHA) protein
MGRRCTQCGGLMASADEAQQKMQAARQVSVSVRASDLAISIVNDLQQSQRKPEGHDMPVMSGIPTLTLYNPTLDIRMVGVNGAVIGRKQGPYSSLFVDNMYISGLHAQLIYKPDTGWCIIDKHSSNGTKLNQRDLLPDVPMSLKSGDIVTLANINLQVSIS